MEIIVKKQEPITPTVAAPEPVRNEPKLTEEERKQRAQDMYASMGWGHPAAEAPAAVEPAVAAAAAVPAAAPAVTPAPVPLTQEQIISRTAKETAIETAKEVSKIVRLPHTQPEPVRPAEPVFEMHPQDAEDFKVIQYLESTGDPKFRGMAEKFVDYVKKHYAYQDEWMAKNAGKQFDPDADEHSAWYEANEVSVNPDDLDRGRIDLRVEARYNQTVKPQLDAMRAKDAFEQNLPSIAHNVTANILKFTEEVNPELAKLLKSADGKPDMSEDNVKKLSDIDPIAGEIMDETVRQELEPLLLELEKTTIPGMNYRLNPAKYHSHAVIDQYRQKAEQEIIKGPADGQVVDGRKFVPLQEMQDLQSAAMKGGTDADKEARLAEIDSKYWTLTVDHVESAIVKSFAEKAKTRIEKADKLAKSKYARGQVDPDPSLEPSRTAAPAAAPIQPAASPAAAPGSTSFKPKPPSMAPQPEVVTTGQPGGGTQKKFGQEITERLFS